VADGLGGSGSVDMRSRSHLGDCTTSGNDVQGCHVCVVGRVRGTGV